MVEEDGSNVYSKRVVALALLIGNLLFAGLPSFSIAQSPAELFQRVINDKVSGTLLAGPYEFQLVQQPGVLASYKAGVDVSDFVAHAAFTNPTEGNSTPWDYGFQFRTTGNNEDLRMFVVSDGTWNFSVGVNSPQQSIVAPNLDTAPGAVNTLDLIVDGSQALFGINGKYGGSVSLPELPVSGDVYASTGFFGDLTVSGRTIELSDFRVSAVPESAASSSAGNATPTGQISPARPVTLHTGSCASLGSVVEPLLEATAPLGDIQGQASAIAAETSFTRVPLLLDDLLEEPHAITVAESPEAPQESIACGDIGGVPDEIGGFVIVLTEQGGSGYQGIAYLAPEDERDRTNVSVFIIPRATALNDLSPTPEVTIVEATPESPLPIVNVQGVPEGTRVIDSAATPVE